MCYFCPPPSELPRLFRKHIFVHPFGAWCIALVNPLLGIAAGESHLMVRFAPMGGAHCRSMSILHVEPTRPAYIPICVFCCCVRLERGIHPCSCWGYNRRWRAIEKWGDAPKSSLKLLSKQSTSASTSPATRATTATSTMLATATALLGVEAALCRSCKRLLPHVPDGGDLKLCVVGRCVCCERHCRHLLLDSQLIGCQLVDCHGYL
jgi:hypothetical protein